LTAWLLKLSNYINTAQISAIAEVDLHCSTRLFLCNH